MAGHTFTYTQVYLPYMGQRKTGPILTSTRKDVLRGEYESGTRQTRKEHEDAIKENAKLSLGDLQFLFNHISHGDLSEIIGGGEDPEAGPIAHDGNGMELEDLDWANARKFFTKHVGREGKVWPPDQNPDAKTPYDWYLDELKKPNKATPEMQRTLIDCVALLCRSAEAGELDVHELIERGVERYYRAHPTSDNQLVNLRSWPEEKHGPEIEEYWRQTGWNSSNSGAGDSDKSGSSGYSFGELKDAKPAMSRYLARKNMD